mmetsp:Transcript_9646/g.20908  ORF Transcript_9646/g.20908 Transcript_9646/m.20908 type:complete len:247 (+) Transcript_9646:699-1439(+)
MLHHPLRQNFGRPKRIPPMNHRDRPARARQHQRVLHGRVAPSHDQHVLPPVHVPVARGAAAHASPPELVLALDVEPVALGAGRHDHGVGFDGAGIGPHPERPGGGVDPDDRLGLEGGAEIDGLLSHQAHHRRTGDVEQSGIVLHVHPLSLQLSSHGRSHHHRLQPRPRGVDGGAEPRRAPAHDGDPLGPLGGDPRVFELGVVVVLLFHLGVAFGVLALFQFGEELLFRGEVEVGFGAFAALLLFVA